jgi:GNAT superfamily N-acetyltransferase
LTFRYATIADGLLLAEMNLQLIRDEGHRNPMSLPELRQRMEGWLAGEYQAVVIEDNEPSGYALFRLDEDQVYLRQFFVRRDRRRQGIGRSAIRWLTEHAWHDRPRIRVDVLIGNRAAIEFWRAVGFADYALSLELPL